MRSIRLFVLAYVVALFFVPAAAQEPPRLLFEVTVDGTVVARPELRVPLGQEGRLSLDREPDLQLRFTPTSRGDDLALAFTINSGGRELRPVLRIARTLRGTLELPPPRGAETLRLVVSWIQ
jgi:hypothetical protein